MKQEAKRLEANFSEIILRNKTITNAINFFEPNDVTYSKNLQFICWILAHYNKMNRYFKYDVTDPGSAT